jgi:hypothetical protein
VAIVVVRRIDEEPDELSFRGKIAVKELSFGGKSMPKRMRENKITPTIINTPVFTLFFCISTVLGEFTGLTAISHPSPLLSCFCAGARFEVPA